jgi:hypothetical protein
MVHALYAKVVYMEVGLGSPVSEATSLAFVSSRVLFCFAIEGALSRDSSDGTFSSMWRRSL